MGETPRPELELMLPCRFVADCPGLAFDIGGSVAKFVYRNKADWEAYQTSTGDRSRNKLRMVSFSHSELNEGLDYIKENAYITPPIDGAPTPIYGTGLGTATFGALIKEKLNVQANTLMEFDSFVEAHRYLYQHVPWTEFEYPLELSDEDKDSLATQINAILEKTPGPTDQEVYPEAGKAYRKQLFKKIGKVVPGEEDKPPTPKPKRRPGEMEEMEDSLSKYPALLATMGSAFAYLKVKSPGQNFQMIDVCNRGGKTFMSLGSLLLGIKSYNEIIDLAEKGDYTKVTKSEESANFDGVSSFAFAKGKTIGDFKREDIAAALLFQTVQDCVQNLAQLAAAYSLRNVMLAGSFTTRPFVRRMINKEWCRRLFQQAQLANNTNEVTLRILKPGPYLGAFGCMINSVNPFRPA